MSFHVVCMQVEAAGVNRLDLIQASGKYPPPPGESNILGVEGIISLLRPITPYLDLEYNAINRYSSVLEQ